MVHDDFALSYAFIMLLLERYVKFCFCVLFLYDRHSGCWNLGCNSTWGAQTEYKATKQLSGVGRLRSQTCFASSRAKPEASFKTVWRSTKP